MNNMVEQDHRFMKRIIRPGLGFGSYPTAWRTIQGYETMHMIRKGQIEGIEKGDIQGSESVHRGYQPVATNSLQRSQAKVLAFIDYY